MKKLILTVLLSLGLLGCMSTGEQQPRELLSKAVYNLVSVAITTELCYNEGFYSQKVLTDTHLAISNVFSMYAPVSNNQVMAMASEISDKTLVTEDSCTRALPDLLTFIAEYK